MDRLEIKRFSNEYGHIRKLEEQLKEAHSEYIKKVIGVEGRDDKKFLFETVSTKVKIASRSQWFNIDGVVMKEGKLYLIHTQGQAWGLIPEEFWLADTYRRVARHMNWELEERADEMDPEK